MGPISSCNRLQAFFQAPTELAKSPPAAVQRISKTPPRVAKLSGDYLHDLTCWLEGCFSMHQHKCEVVLWGVPLDKQWWSTTLRVYSTPVIFQQKTAVAAVLSDFASCRCSPQFLVARKPYSSIGGIVAFPIFPWCRTYCQVWARTLRPSFQLLGWTNSLRRPGRPHAIPCRRLI